MVEQCPVWKSVGECTNNPAYMYYNCRRSCTVCNVTYLHDVPHTVSCREMGVRSGVFKAMP